MEYCDTDGLCSPLTPLSFPIFDQLPPTRHYTDGARRLYSSCLMSFRHQNGVSIPNELSTSSISAYPAQHADEATSSSATPSSVNWQAAFKSAIESNMTDWTFRPSHIDVAVRPATRLPSTTWQWNFALEDGVTGSERVLHPAWKVTMMRG